MRTTCVFTPLDRTSTRMPAACDITPKLDTRLCVCATVCEQLWRFSRRELNNVMSVSGDEQVCVCVCVRACVFECVSVGVNVS